MNDEFCLQGWTECFDEFNIKIFNRWGEKVFESNRLDFCWDGIYQNQVLDASVFVYYINAKYIGIEKAIEKKGNISLIR
jgi:gliding motility-associated-like protein